MKMYRCDMCGQVVEEVPSIVTIKPLTGEQVDLCVECQARIMHYYDTARMYKDFRIILDIEPKEDNGQRTE